MPAIQNNRVFRFEDVSSKSLGMVHLSIETQNNISPIDILVDLDDVDISALIGLHVLEVNCLMVDSLFSRLWHQIILCVDPLELADKWRVPVICNQHHLYVHLNVPMSNFYTTQ